MFIVATFEDTVTISPENFGNELRALKLEIRKKYVNKVIKDVGLGVALFDILDIGDGFVYPGEGSAYPVVKFRMVVFKPFIGEVIKGTIKHSGPQGIYVSLGGFFDDILVPSHLLQQPAHFNEEEKLWYWDYEDNKMWWEENSTVLLRVTAVAFHERDPGRPQPPHHQHHQLPPPPPHQQQQQQPPAAAALRGRPGSSQGGSSEGPQPAAAVGAALDAAAGVASSTSSGGSSSSSRGGALDTALPPMLVVGAANEAGLGCTQWW